MLKEYGFAASAWTNDRGNFALRTAEIDAVENLLSPKRRRKSRTMIVNRLFRFLGQRLKATRQSDPIARLMNVQ